MSSLTGGGGGLMMMVSGVGGTSNGVNHSLQPALSGASLPQSSTGFHTFSLTMEEIEELEQQLDFEIEFSFRSLVVDLVG